MATALGSGSLGLLIVSLAGGTGRVSHRFLSHLSEQGMLRLSAKRKTTRITLPVIFTALLVFPPDVSVDRIPFPMRLEPPSCWYPPFLKDGRLSVYNPIRSFVLPMRMA